MASACRQDQWRVPGRRSCLDGRPMPDKQGHDVDGTVTRGMVKCGQTIDVGCADIHAGRDQFFDVVKFSCPGSGHQCINRVNKSAALLGRQLKCWLPR